MSEGQIELRSLLLDISSCDLGPMSKRKVIWTFFEKWEVSVIAKRPLADDFQPKPPETYTGI